MFAGLPARFSIWRWKRQGQRDYRRGQQHTVVNMDEHITMLDPDLSQFQTLLQELPSRPLAMFSAVLVIDMETRDPRPHYRVGDLFPIHGEVGTFQGVVTEIRRKRWIEADWTRETEWEMVIDRPWADPPTFNWLEDELFPRVSWMEK